jgi:RNA polymerase sigma-70 factor (ECF subfamily)
MNGRRGSDPSIRVPSIRELFDEHTPRLFAFAAMILSDAVLAEDAVQESWMRAVRALESGTEVRDYESWLNRIVRNEALRLRGERGLKPLDPEAAAPEQADHVEADDEKRRVREVVEDLATRDAEIIRLMYLEERPADEVRRILRLKSRSALYKRLEKARERFRRAYRDS